MQIPPQTIADTLQTLQQQHQTTPYLHPYAYSPINHAGPSSSSSGAATIGIQAQLDRVREVKSALLEARMLLSRGEGDWGKLSRSLREISSHQQTTLPYLDSLPRPSATLRPSLPTKDITLPPAELISTLARNLGIEVYTEDSQFGLLKQTLAIAGNCFVIDIELETDPVPEEESTPVPAAAASHHPGSSQDRVRLSRIEAHFVPHGGGHDKSDHLRDVTERVVRGYLEAKYESASGLIEVKERAERIQLRIEELKDVLREIKELDGKEGEGQFAALEEAVRIVQGWRDGKSVFAPEKSCILPTFKLLPGGNVNPDCTLCPAREEVPGGSKSESGLGWMIRCDQIPVRRSWLNEDVGEGERYDGGVKVENLLYHSSDSPIQPFPYTSQFTHKPSETKGALAQIWCMPSPGPDGFVVGCLGTDDETIRALRKQLVLNNLWLSVFDPKAISSDRGDDADVDLDDLLSDNAPSSIPLDIALVGNKIEIQSPIPHSSSGTMRIQITAQNEAPYLHVSVDMQDDGTGNELNSIRDKAKKGVEDLLSGLRDGQIPTLPDIIGSVDLALR